MLIANTPPSRVRRKTAPAGSFNSAAIRNAGDRLYLIQHLNGREYYVRLYDVIGGRLDENIVVDKSDGNQAMTGLRLSGIATADGHWLFSMYVRSQDNPFIHALSLDGPFAFCLDLPGGGYTNNESEKQWSLAMTQDSSRLYAANPSSGMVAEVSNWANRSS